MSEDENGVSKAALLQSITTEANGFYTQIATVASAFLGGSLLFMDKIAPVRGGASLPLLALGWFALVASIGCVVRLRHMNLLSGGLAMNKMYEEATRINKRTDRLSSLAQGSLIFGMALLVIVGIMNVNQSPCNERILAMSDCSSNPAPNERTGAFEQRTIPYGSTGPSGPQATRPETQTPNQPPPQPAAVPNQGGPKK